VLYMSNEYETDKVALLFVRYWRGRKYRWRTVYGLSKRLNAPWDNAPMSRCRELLGLGANDDS
jgi:hypothetical protein